MSIVSSPPPDASSTARGLVSTLAQTWAGVKTFTSKLIAAAGIQVAALFNTNGGTAGDRGVVVGFSTADPSVNSAAKPLSAGNGIGGTYVELFYVDATGGLHSGKAAGYGIFHGAGNGNQYLKIDPTNGVQLYLSGFTAGLNASGQFVAVQGGGNVARFDTTARLDQSGTDSSGTPGAAIINKPKGISAIAVGASSVVITNSLVTAASHITITPYSRDATCKELKVTPAAGSFTVDGSANATAAVKFSWEVSSLL